MAESLLLKLSRESSSYSTMIGFLLKKLESSIATSNVLLLLCLIIKGLRLIFSLFFSFLILFKIEKIIDESTPPLNEVAIFTSATSLF